MLETVELTTKFLNQDVPLWFALVMGFTSPYMWSRYVKNGASKLFNRYFGTGEDEADE
jgi:hypothetical protein